MVAAGNREIVLTGVDITAYGLDLLPATRLGALVRKILQEVPELGRLRLSSLDAPEIDADLLRAFEEEPRLAPHLHLSVQSGDDLILKRMKRRHSGKDVVRFCKTVRSLRPDVVFGADLIAGFPTESQDMFANTLRLVDSAGLTWLHVFPYSERPGTPAARMPQVASCVRRARARHLRETGEKAVQRHLHAQIGRVVEALIERPDFARAPDFTPLRLSHPAPAGTLANVRVRSQEGTLLCAEPL